MKKIIFSLLFIFSIISFPIISFSERIEEYNINIRLNEDKSLHIEESIRYNPEGELHHGLIRDIFTKSYNRDFLSYKDRVGIENFNSNLPFSKKIYATYNSYKIGDPDYYLKGTTTFINSYDIYNIIQTSENINQIYLNIIGNYWDMPIDNININLDFNTNYVKGLDVYTGEYGYNTNNYNINGLKISNISPFKANEGLTFRLNLDSSYYEYSRYEKIHNILITYKTIIYNLVFATISLLILILALVTKYKLKIHETIVPEFKVNTDISPTLASKLLKRSKYNLITITLMSLISKGLIKSKNKYKPNEFVIEKGEKLEDIDDENEEKIYYLAEDKKIEEALNDENLLAPEEKTLLLNLCNYKEDILENSKNIAKVKTKVDLIINRAYSRLCSEIVIYKVISIILIIISLSLNITLNIIDYSLLLVIIPNIINILFLNNIVKYSPLAQKYLINLEGFIMYFDTTEKNIFEELKTEKEIISYAKKMLPYAISLGIQKKFIDKLDIALNKLNIERNNIYPYIYLPFYRNMYRIDRNITDSVYKNTPKYSDRKFNGSGGFSGGSGFSGGGYSGGGGSSW